MRHEYKIPEENRENVLNALAKLNKMAKRLKVKPVAHTLLHSHWETYFRNEREKELNITSRREWLTLTIEGEQVILDGWEFVGAIHHTSDGNIVASLPGQELDRKYRDALPTCDHCGFRRARNTTYIVRRTKNKKVIVKRVGSSCLRDFVESPSRDPHTIGRWAEYLASFHEAALDWEDVERGSRIEAAWSLEGFLAAAALVIRHEGWLSKSAAAAQNYATPTVTLILDYLAVRHDVGVLEMLRRWGETAPSEADRALAAAAIEWVSEELEPRTDLNDYLYNLTVIARAGRVTLRTAPLAASMIATYKRHLNKTQEAKQQRVISNHVGEPSKRIDIPNARIEAMIDMPPTEWGQSTLVKIFDESGNLLVWFASNDPYDTIKPGDVADLRATVVRHEVRNGIKQTKVNRCKFSNIRSESSAAVSSDN